MLKVNQTETDIEGGLVDILAEYAVLTKHMIAAIGGAVGTEDANAMVLRAFIMGTHPANEDAGATKEAPDA